MDKQVEINYKEGLVNVTLLVSCDIADFLENDRKRRNNESRQDRRYLTLYELDENQYLTEDILIESFIISKEKIETLKANINLLTNVQKRRLHMYFFDNLTYLEIATIENVSIKSIYRSVNNALSKLQKTNPF